MQNGFRQNRRHWWTFVLALALAGTAIAQESAQESARESAEGRTLVVTPATLELDIGGKAVLEAEVVDDAGEPLDVGVIFFSRKRRSVTVDAGGNVEALEPGDATIVVRSRRAGGPRLSITVPVKVAFPPLQRVEFEPLPSEIHVGTTQRIECRAYDVEGVERADAPVMITSSDPSVAEIDAYGNLIAHAPGTFTAKAAVEGVEVELAMSVIGNPVERIDLEADATEVRTGDVVHFLATGRDAGGGVVQHVPIQYSFVADPDDDLGPPASGQIAPDGRFVAETPGRYTIVASCGRAASRKTIRARPRGVQGKLEVIGRGKVLDTHTSDLWVWEGVDGRDYAVTGTWGANGDAHFWDVTDPTNIERIATVTVDARTVNDVKVSEDGRLCILSREGASNRRNGIVLFDVTDPREPKEVSTFDENLTGGVHNLFIEGNKVFALSAGRRYDVIRIDDPRRPYREGSFELDNERHSIHDVWVVDGIAYSSNWRDGVQIVDVGNGVAGGTSAAPVRIGGYAYPSGWNHAAFPFTSRQTGRFYVIAGDEAFPYGLHVEDTPTTPRGWFHFIDFTDMDNPVEVARYQVPEAGTHNLWVDGDILYGAYYNGGVRVVDISGELMGDLYRQGREIAWFVPTDKDGFIPNAPMVWGPQPHKGTLFISDWNTGLWALKLTK